MEQHKFTEYIEWRSLYVSFDMPGLVSGVLMDIAAAGEVLLPFGWSSILTVWDGTTPSLSIKALIDGVYTNIGDAKDLSASDFVVVPNYISIPITYPQEIYLFKKQTPLYVVIDDGAGGNPGSTQGELEIVVAIATRIAS